MLMFFGPLRGWEKLLPAAAQQPVAAMLADPRVMETSVALRMFRASPLLGTGLGSYGELNAALHPGRFVSFFAHNDYAQFLAEAGLLGGGVLAAAALVFGKRLLRFMGQAESPDRPLGIAAWAAVAAIAVHSFFDWNLHLPSNGLLACIAAGVALAAGLPMPTATAVPKPLMPRWLPGVVLSAACLASLAMLARDAASEQTQRRLRSAIAADRLRMKGVNRLAPAAELAAAVAAGERMAFWDRSNPRLALLLAQGYLHLAGLPDAAGGAIGAFDSARLWTNRTRACAAFVHGLPESRGGDRP
jgi:hypothetical protein